MHLEAHALQGVGGQNGCSHGSKYFQDHPTGLICSKTIDHGRQPESAVGVDALQVAVVAIATVIGQRPRNDPTSALAAIGSCAC